MTKEKILQIQNLLVATVNIAILRGVIRPGIIDKINAEFECVLFGKRTLIRCEAHDYRESDIFIAAWWGVPERLKTMHVRTREDLTAMDFRCSFFIERDRGWWIEDYGESAFIDMYCSHQATRDLTQIPAIIPNGFKRERKIDVVASSGAK